MNSCFYYSSYEIDDSLINNKEHIIYHDKSHILRFINEYLAYLSSLISATYMKLKILEHQSIKNVILLNHGIVTLFLNPLYLKYLIFFKI